MSENIELKQCYFNQDIDLRLELARHKINVARCCHDLNKWENCSEIDLSKLDNLYEEVLKARSTFVAKKCNMIGDRKCVVDLNAPINQIILECCYNCNLKCIMCRDRLCYSKEEEDIYYTILENLKGHKINCIGLTSVGEPFYNKERCMKYLESLTLNDFNIINILSNGILLNTNDIKKLKEIQDNSGVKLNITFSIDGITPETYKFIRGVDKFFDVMQNAYQLIDQNMFCGVNFVVQPKNINELIPAYEFWSNLKIDFNWIVVNWHFYDNPDPKYDSVRFVVDSPQFKEFCELRKQDKKLY